jgi:dethiobiotin synthase
MHFNNLKTLSNFPAIFITGTDTDIGKTIASAWLCSKLSADYFKPIQSGIQNTNPYTDSDFIQSLNLPKTKVFEECYKFQHSLSPHLSAQYANTHIELDKINIPLSISNSNKTVIIEGAGGIFVPLKYSV